MPRRLMLLMVIVQKCSSVEDHIEIDHWNYEEYGPYFWKQVFPKCGNTRQSPINICRNSTVYRSFPPIKFSNSHNATQQFLLRSNGHGITITQLNRTSFPLTFEGGGFNESFNFLNLHIHWGEKDTFGSEHQIDDQVYSAELHFVYSNKRGDTIAALGFFIQTQPEELVSLPQESAWPQFFNVSSTVKRTTDIVAIDLPLSSLMSYNLQDFWRYEGSFTVPPCTENVVWTVFSEPIVLQDTLFNSFRRNILAKNYRPIQPLHDRRVYRSFIEMERTMATNQSPFINSKTNRIISSTKLQLYSFEFLNIFLILNIVCN